LLSEYRCSFFAKTSKIYWELSHSKSIYPSLHLVKVNQSLIQTLSRMESEGIGMHTLNHMCRKGKHVRNNTQIIYNVWKNGKEWSIKNCIPWIGDATTWNEQLHHHCLEQLRDVLKEPLWYLWPSRVSAVTKSTCFLYQGVFKLRTIQIQDTNCQTQAIWSDESIHLSVYLYNRLILKEVQNRKLPVNQTMKTWNLQLKNVKTYIPDAART
jgi:hypothetical protein